MPPSWGLLDASRLLPSGFCPGAGLADELPGGDVSASTVLSSGTDIAAQSPASRPIQHLEKKKKMTGPSGQVIRSRFHV
jgi:hypothetical protein